MDVDVRRGVEEKIYIHIALSNKNAGIKIPSKPIETVCLGWRMAMQPRESRDGPQKKEMADSSITMGNGIKWER